MGLKINKFFILIFLILLQSCSGGRIGTFLESSFKNIEETKRKEDNKENLKNKKVVSSDEKAKKNIEETKRKEDNKENLKNKKVVSFDEKAKKNIEETKRKEDTLKKIKVINFEEKLKNNKKNTENNKSFSKTKFKPKSYKMILILKDVDPKDPIEDFSTILRNSDVNFEIEKIERFFDSKNKNIKKN